MASKPQSSEMPFPCSVGLHRAQPVAHWNHGYYFSRCRRCGADLVRTAYSRWHVPRGHRVVWRATPPESHVDVELAPEEALQPPLDSPPAADRNPATSEQVAEEAAAPLAAATALSEPAPDGETRPVEPTTRSVVPDFMGEGGEVRPAGLVAAAPQSQPAERTDPESADMSWLHRLTFRPEAPVERRGSEAAGRPRLGLVLLLLLIAAVLVAAVLSLPIGSPTPKPVAGPPAPEPIAAEAPARVQSTNAFVTASLLNCRSAPARQADPLLRLQRGDEILILAREGEWASVAIGNEQCWLLDRYTATVRPMD